MVTAAMNAAVTNEVTANQRATTAEQSLATALEVIVNLSNKCAVAETTRDQDVHNYQDDVNELHDKKKAAFRVLILNFLGGLISLVVSCIGAFAPATSRSLYYATLVLSISVSVIAVIGIVLSRNG